MDETTCPTCRTESTECEQAQHGGSGSRELSSKPFGSLSRKGVLVLLICGGLAAVFLLPFPRRAPEASARTVCKNNLKAIGLAMHEYHDHFGTFPPAVTYNAQGKPMHSWRVLILPYLDQESLYSTYRMNEPWDSPNNIRLQSKMPSVFACPKSQNDAVAGITSYAGIAAPNSILNPVSCTRVEDITDGANNTLMVAEVDGAKIPWTEPKDLAFAVGISSRPETLWSQHTGGFHALFADGTVRYIWAGIDSEQLLGMTTLNGAEPIGER